MVHLRIVAPADRSGRIASLLEESASTANLVVLEGAARKPPGDVILCDVAREDASIVIGDLRELGIERDGSIAIEMIDSQISDAADAAERAAAGAPSDAVVWEEVETRTSESTDLSGNFLVFIVFSALLASVAIFLDSPILLVGAMVVGPEFGPLAGLCVALVERRPRFALRSLIALAIGFPLAITAAYFFALFCDAVGLVEADFGRGSHPFTEFVSDPSWFSLIVAVIAGSVGVLSLTAAKSGALVGVLVSVTTIPAAANIGIAAALQDWDEWRGAMGQLSLNLVAIVLAGVVTLLIQRRAYERRRRRHQSDLAANDSRSRSP